MAEENKEQQKDDVTINDLLRKILYQGVGMAAGAKERVEKAVKELIGEKKITNEEGKKIVEKRKYGEVSRQLLRQLGQYGVNIYKNHLQVRLFLLVY